MKKILLSVIVSMSMVFSLLTGCVAAVRTPPPPARVEVRPAAPSAYAVWIDGYWERRQGDWFWVSGHWVKRPKPKAVWVPGHWKRTPWGWKRVRGHGRY